MTYQNFNLKKNILKKGKSNITNKVNQIQSWKPIKVNQTLPTQIIKVFLKITIIIIVLTILNQIKNILEDL